MPRPISTTATSKKWPCTRDSAERSERNEEAETAQHELRRRRGRPVSLILKLCVWFSDKNVNNPENLHCCNGLKFGTATRGGIENVTFTNSVIFNEDVNYKARVISGIDIGCVDGGARLVVPGNP